MKSGLWLGIGALAMGFLAVADEQKAPATDGTITGKITWEGSVPERKKLEVNKDNDKCECDAKGGEKKPFKLDESLVVDPETKGVANCVLWLKGVAGGRALGPAEIDQKGCLFSPHVALITKGQKVKVLNPDKIAHNFNISAAKVNSPTTPNISIGKFKPSVEVAEENFSKPEFIRIACDIHLWMGGWIAVMENGYAARSDEKGCFKLEGVPPGKYTVALWHEPLDKDGGAIVMEKADVTVEAGKPSDLSFTLSAPK